MMGFASVAVSPTIDEIPSKVIITSNSFLAVQGIQTPSRVLGVEFIGESSEKTTLNCLIQKESGGDETRINPKDTDGQPRFGLLQYDLATFKEWCVWRYGYEDDIFNGAIQKKCAEKMIFQDKQGWRWPPLKKCQKYQ